MNPIDLFPRARVALPRVARGLGNPLRSLALCALLAVALGGGLVACAPEDADAPSSATVDADAAEGEMADDADIVENDSDDGDAETDAGRTDPADLPPGLSYDMLAAAIVANEMFPEPVTLVDGHAEEPAAPGSASMITADLHPEAAWGDLDGDGDAEAVTVLYVSGGGSGTFRYLVAFDEVDGQPIQLASALIGDRTQIDELSVEEGRVVLEVTTHGPDDPMCCPTMEDTMVFQLTGGELLDVATE